MTQKIMKNFKSLSGSEKLAILVMSIGLDAAKEALKGLKPKEISKIILQSTATFLNASDFLNYLLLSFNLYTERYTYVGKGCL